MREWCTRTLAFSPSTVISHVVHRGGRFVGGECFDRRGGRMTTKINISERFPQTNFDNGPPSINRDPASKHPDFSEDREMIAIVDASLRAEVESIRALN